MCFKIIMGSNSLFKKTYTCIDIFIWAFPGSSVGKESVSNAGDHISIPDSGRFPGDKISYPRQCSWASLVAQMVKNPPAIWETWVWSLGWEDSPGEGKDYSMQYSGLENSMDCMVHGVAKSQTWLSDFHLGIVNFIWYIRKLEICGFNQTHYFPMANVFSHISIPINFFILWGCQWSRPNSPILSLDMWSRLTSQNTPFLWWEV